MSWENCLGILREEDYEAQMKLSHGELTKLLMAPFSSEEEYWADKMKPSRRRKLHMTRSQRHLLAQSLKELRRERLAATQVASGKSWIGRLASRITNYF